MQLALLKELGHQDRGTEKDSPDTLHLTLNHLFDTDLRGRRHLLVLDDVWDYSIASSLRCASMQGAILVTARQSVTDAAATVTLQPNDSSHSAAAELMGKLLNRSVEDLPPTKKVSICGHPSNAYRGSAAAAGTRARAAAGP
jgi:hypothetical protein